MRSNLHRGIYKFVFSLWPNELLKVSLFEKMRNIFKFLLLFAAIFGVSNGKFLIKCLYDQGVGMSNFTTMTGHFFHYIKSGFLVHHYIKNQCLFSSSYYKNQTIKKNEKNIESLSFVNFWSYFTYGVSTYGVLALKNKSLKSL